MSTFAHWRDRLFYAARASTVSLEPREAAELYALLEEAERERSKAVLTSALVRDHLFVDDPHHPGECHVKVPVGSKFGYLVGTCCGYPRSAHVEVKE